MNNSNQDGSRFESDLCFALNLKNQLYFPTTRHQTHFSDAALMSLNRNMVTNCSLHVIYYRNESLYCPLLVINEKMVNTQMTTSTLVQCVKISPSRSCEEKTSLPAVCYLKRREKVFLQRAFNVWKPVFLFLGIVHYSGKVNLHLIVRIKGNVLLYFLRKKWRSE